MPTQPMPKWSANEIVTRYQTFFQQRGHLMISGSPLVVPDNTTSFIIAGMQPLLPYLRGERVPPASRLTALQRCLRSDDADRVGKNGRKLTFFHMLGNWSIGEYGRHEAIALALDLVCGDLGIAQSDLWVTTFAGAETPGLPPDEQAPREWQRHGIPDERIVPLGMDDNFWSTGGPGPCGPCTEIFVDRGAAHGCGAPTCRPGCECERFLEIWNLVFIEFARHEDGSYTPLPLRSVDTGMGLERIAAILQGRESVFAIDLFAPALARLAEMAVPGVVGGGSDETRARHLILDHTRAALFAGLAGVTPSPDRQGSVMRHLIRRAARQGHVLGLTRPFLGEIIAPLAAAHGDLLTADEHANAPLLAALVTAEEARFSRVLAAGLRDLERLRPNSDGVVPGATIFRLHAERGFPADLAAEVLAERGVTVDWVDYERALADHHAISRVSVKRRFGGNATR